MRNLLIGLALSVVTAAASADDMTTKQAATTAAIADSVSTYLAVASGATEVNPLVGANLGGLIMLAGVKLGALEMIENSDQTEQEKSEQKRTAAAMWGSFSVSNLLVALSAASPIAILAGLASGSYLWMNSYADEETPVASAVVASSQ